MPFLLQTWDAVAHRVRQARTIALFLDFDGTLAPLCVRPEEARLPSASRRALLRLSVRRRLRTWVISGRSYSDVSPKIDIAGVHCMGLYGGEDGRNGHGAAPSRAISQARELLARRLAPIPGIRIEDKGAAFAVHYRGSPAASVRLARDVLASVAAEFPSLRAMDGEHAWEVLPRDLRGKGHAALACWRSAGHDALPIFIGDDAGDESAFAALSFGITVCASTHRRTHARYRLRGPAEVSRFLERLEKEIA
jgi:trehalose 6-phosphate phosphatase